MPTSTERGTVGGYEPRLGITRRSDSLMSSSSCGPRVRSQAMPTLHTGGATVGPLPRDLRARTGATPGECRSSQSAPVSLRSDSGTTGWHCNTLKEKRDHQRSQYDHDLLQVPAQRWPLHRRRDGPARGNSQPGPPRRQTDRVRLEPGRCLREHGGGVEPLGGAGSIGTSFISNAYQGCALPRQPLRSSEDHSMN